MSTLVTDLGALPEKAKRRSSQYQRRRSGLVEPIKSPDQKEWKNRQTTSGVVADNGQLQEGRLPVIVEGKRYPRKTLEGLEISRLLDEDAAVSQSPELGPPPVAHFDVAEPITFMPPMKESGTAEAVHASEDPEDVKPLPDNLERRRRRRASALLEDMSTLNAPIREASIAAAQNISLKPGAKRKLDVREQGYKEESVRSGPDDFAFQRKAAASDIPQARPKSSRFTKASTPSIAGREMRKDSTSRQESGDRRVLAPKSTNSPSKPRGTGANDKVVPAKYEEHKRMNAIVADLPAHIRPPDVEQIAISTERDSTECSPKTPAGLGLFSPASTEPSARVEQRPEIALTASVEDVLGGADGRASRRARGAVSYAEPSLRAKMRRPTKELVAAVADQANGFKTQQRQSSAKAEAQERQVSQEPSGANFMRTVTIKREKPSDDFPAWKGLPESRDEPTSPLANKMAKCSEMEAGSDAEKVPDGNVDTHQLEAGLDSLCIFDGPDSSPHDSPNTITVQTGKTSRRHSSNHTSLRVDQEFEKPAVPHQRPQSKQNSAAMNDRPPRPKSAASLRKENLGRDEKVGLKRSASVSTSKSSTGTNASSASVDVGPARTERAAARRRSMMI